MLFEVPEGFIKGRKLKKNKETKCLYCNEPTGSKKRKYCKDHGPETYRNDQYLKALLESSSISDALRSLGMQTRGNNYSIMKRVIEKNGIQDKFLSERINWGR